MKKDKLGEKRKWRNLVLRWMGEGRQTDGGESDEEG